MALGDEQLVLFGVNRDLDRSMRSRSAGGMGSSAFAWRMNRTLLRSNSRSR